MYRERFRLDDWLTRKVYRARHAAMRASLSAARDFARKIISSDIVHIDLETKAALNHRYDALMNLDLTNVQAGAYPRALLFDSTFADQWRHFPRLVREMTRQRRRCEADLREDFSDEISLADYPDYFLKNFHWQSDGYLSEQSAELYNLSVEFLFMGMANVMRRQVIPPITRHLRGRNHPARILDVACGTGELLDQLVRAHPQHAYFGLDISPHYLSVAKRRHASTKDVSFLRGNAEELPFKDGYFDAVTNIYLLHELPRQVRRKAVAEMLRVLKPGGLLVIEDAAQSGEIPAISNLFDRYGDEANEPYFDDYLEDDTTCLLEELGASVIRREWPFVAKVTTARKR